MFDSVTQGGARNLAVVFTKKLKQCRTGDDPSLPQCPTDGFVKKVVLVAEQQFGNAEGVFNLPCFDKGEGGNYGDTALPKV